MKKASLRILPGGVKDKRPEPLTRSNPPEYEGTPSELCLRESMNRHNQKCSLEPTAFTSQALQAARQHHCQQQHARRTSHINNPNRIQSYIPQTASKPISVADLLSPSRSHVSQNIKPLFANRERDRDRVQRQGSLSCKNALSSGGTKFQHTHTRANKMSVHQPIQPQSTTGLPLSSFDSGSEQMQHEPNYQMSDITTQQYNGSESNLSGHLGGPFQIRVRELTLASDNVSTASDPTAIRNLNENQQKTDEMLYQQEPVAEELPLNIKKYNKSHKSRSKGAVALSTAATRKKERVSRKERVSQSKSKQQTSLMVAMAPYLSQSNACSPSGLKNGTIFNAFGMATALKHHHKNAPSVSSTSSGVGDVRKQTKSGQKNTCSSVHLRKSTTSSVVALSSRRSGYSEISASAMATATQQLQTITSPKGDSGPFMDSIVAQEEHGVSRLSRLSQYGRGASEDIAAVTITPTQPDKKKTSILGQKTAKVKSQKDQSQVITIVTGNSKQSKFPRASLLTSPTRTQNYQLGVLNQTKRKGSIKKGTKIQSSSQIQSLSLKNFVQKQQQYQAETMTVMAQNAYITKTVAQKASNVNKPQVVLQGDYSNRGSSSNIKGKKRRTSRGGGGGAFAPSPQDLSQITTLKSRASLASLKIRRSQDDKSTRRLITPGLGSEHTQQSTPPKIMHQASGSQNVVTAHIGPLKCQLNKGFRQLLKKSKSQSRVNSKRHPLGEVCANVITPKDAKNEVQKSKQEDQIALKPEAEVEADNDADEEPMRIKILAPVNNFFAHNSAHGVIPRGDNTPLSIQDIIVTGSVAEQQSVIFPNPANVVTIKSCENSTG